MAFDAVTYAILKNLIKNSGSGFTSIQVSPDGTTIDFITTDGDTISISVNDWNGLTVNEKEKISKLVINGDGKKVLYNDGTYKPLPDNKVTEYPSLNNKPSINSVELLGNKTAAQLGFSDVSVTGEYEDLKDKPFIPTLISQLDNDSGFVSNTVDNLINYYLKSDVYTKVEVNELLSGLASLDIKIVPSLPTTGISTTTIYLIKETGNSYSQWMYINNAWANIGSTQVDLSDYYNKTQVTNLLNEKVDKRDGWGLTQENFSPTLKQKLDGLTQYVPKIASESTLGEAKVDGITIVADENGVISLAGGGQGLPPNNVIDLRAEAGPDDITLFWGDPDDTLVDGQLLSAWKGTRVVYKIGSYPNTPSDGTVVMDNTIRNAYSEEGYRITGLSQGFTYYFQLFPYSTTGAINTNSVNRIEATPKSIFKVMTVVIDTTNSNVSTSVTYEDDALEMTPGSDEWDKWFGIYPCLFKDGAEVGKLNPNDFTQFLNGSPADITSGTAGDVMICFPIRGLTMTNVSNKITIKMTNDPNDPNFEYYAHQRGTVKKDRFYLSAYRVDANGYSISGVLSAGGITLNNWRDIMHSFGVGYDVGAHYQLVFRQCMYVLKYKNLNSQESVGYGESTASTTIVNGETNKSGMNFGGINPKDGKSKMKLFGLEDFWGRKSEFIDGCTTDANRRLLTATENFNNAGTGYKVGETLSYMAGIGFISKVAGTTDGGFLPTAIAGSGTTYYCDFGIRSERNICFYGGFYQTIANNGIFCQLINSNGEANAGIGARKMYL